MDRDFHHPYKPYNIQKEFMNALYECIDDGKIGILESPTGKFWRANSLNRLTDLLSGTGKSLSLICGSLTWLRDHQWKDILDVDGPGNTELTLEPDWVVEHERNQRKKAIAEKKFNLEARLARAREKDCEQKQRYDSNEPQAKRIKINHDQTPLDGDVEAQFLLADYDSDVDGKKSGSTGISSAGDLSIASIDLLEKLGMNVKTCDSPDDPEVVHETKIYYCSRTHSQLTQFANEVRRVRIPPNIEMHSEIGQIGPDLAEDEVKYLSLGSRKNLCINPSVSKLGNSIAINERCLELQQPKIVHEMKCVFLPKKDNESLVNEFRDRTLAQVRDIEDMGSLGKKIGICPYYASRASIKLSEIITLPYPMLLQKSAREALDISLKDHVVIIDEAHNLMDAISSIYSINVSNAQLKRSRAQLGIYLQKFRHKLKGKNRIYITQVVRVLDSLSAYLEAKTAQTGDLEGAVEVSDLMAGKGVDQINLYKLMHYLQESKLARKVEGYNTHTEETQSKTGGSRQLATPVLSHIQSFLQALTNPGAEGRFFYSRTDDNDTSVRYMLLDPTYHFKEIVEEARAVILAGGTMSPMDDYRRHLFAYLEPDRLKTLSCGHVIPEENLIAWPVTRGPSNIDFDFTFEKRNSTYMMDELGKCLTELSRTVPDGMVVFFPSYAYLQQVVARWQTPGLASSTSRWAQLSKHKTLFRESKDDASVDNVLVQYAAAIEAGDGGLLLSVVGGKMSEGINFSDKLGRGVVVVGLPFPNIQSLEWKAKLEYIENASVSRGETKAEGKKVAREFYENACMRAVNQSIGRAIRHQKDYASIILLDRRYDTPRIAEKLPNWIKQGLVKSADRRLFSDVISRLDRFFKVVRE